MAPSDWESMTAMVNGELWDGRIREGETKPGNYIQFLCVLITVVGTRLRGVGWGLD